MQKNNFIHYLNVILYRAYAEMKAEVSTGILGMSIWVLEPLVYLGAFYLIFSVMGLKGGTDTIAFLLPGLVLWKWFAASVARGALSITHSAYVIQQIHVPKFVFLGTALLTAFYHFVIIFFLLIVFLILYGIEPNIAWFSLVPIIFLQMLLIIGIAGFFAALMPMVPDLQVVVFNGLTLAFFLSGIFFDISQSTGLIRKVLFLNPMAVLIDSFRKVLAFGKTPNWYMLLYVLIFSLCLIIVTAYLLKKWERQYPKVLSQ